MKIYTISNQKGGVGKTTTAHALASGLSLKGYKVLAVDADPQTNLTYNAGLPQNSPITLYDLMKERNSITEAIQTEKNGLFDIVAGSLTLAGADMEFTQVGREYLLKQALEPVKEKYDICVIDTPPTLGILTINAMTASNGVIVPMEANIFSIQGLAQLQGLISNVRKYSNTGLEVTGILLARYNGRATINKDLKETIEGVAHNLHTTAFTTPIRQGVIVGEAHIEQQSIFTYGKNSNVAKDYSAFIQEFIERTGI